VKAAHQPAGEHGSQTGDEPGARVLFPI
jgi:hypothetical protein